MNDTPSAMAVQCYFCLFAPFTLSVAAKYNRGNTEVLFDKS